MGGIGGIARAGITAGVLGFGAGLGLHLTSEHQDQQTVERTKRNEGKSALERERHGDDFMSNLDGWLRLGAGVGALGSLATAGVALLTGRPHLAVGGLAIGTALSATALLAGGQGSTVGERVHSNLVSAGGAISGAVHAAHIPVRPKLANQVAKLADAPAQPAPRPSAAQLRAARMDLPGEVDHEVARTNADKALASIDWSKPDIVLWMAGTGSHEQSGHWIRRVAETPEHFNGGGNAVLVDYPATTDMKPSAATGMETLRLVLAGIAERGGEHRVMVGGHSQGAWVIGDAMATPEINAMIDRAVLFGHPGVAAHDYADGHDPKVLELNDPNDPVTHPAANEELLLEGMRAFETGVSTDNIVPFVSAAVTHPRISSFWVARSLDHERWGPIDPHYYDYAYLDALDWLEQAPAR